MKNDPTFGQTEVYYKPFQAVISLKREISAATQLSIAATYQGCNEPIGVCYAPIDKLIKLTLPVAKSVAGVLADSISNDATAATDFIKTKQTDPKSELLALPDSRRSIESESKKNWQDV